MEEKNQINDELSVLRQFANLPGDTLQDNTLVTRILTSPPNTPVQIDFTQIFTPTRRRRRRRCRSIIQKPKRTQGGRKRRRKRRRKTKRKRKRKRRKKRTRHRR
jgi:hypothetical protein